MKISFASGALVATGLFALSAPAIAHVSFETPQATQNSTYKAVLAHPPWLRRRADPQGQRAHPRRRRRGQADAQGRLDARHRRKRPTRKPYMISGEPVTAGSRRDRLVRLARGRAFRRIRVPGAHHGCGRGRFRTGISRSCRPAPHASEAWTEIAAPGQDSHALKMPAPTIRIVAAPIAGEILHGRSDHHRAAVVAGDPGGRESGRRISARHQYGPGTRSPCRRHVSARRKSRGARDVAWPTTSCA